MSKQKRADLLFLLITGFWGASYYLTDLCMKEMPPMFLNAFRFISAFLVLGVFFFKKIVKINLITIKYSILIGLALTGTYIFYAYGISRTSLSNAAFICALPVVFTPLLEFIFKGIKPSQKLFACLVLCVFGLALLTLSDNLKPEIGDIICLGVPLCYAIDLILTEKAVNTEGVDALNMGVFELAFVGIVTLILSFFIEEPRLPQSKSVWVAALFLGLFCTGIAFVVQAIQQKYTTASHVGLIFTLEPVFASIIAFIFANEVLRARSYVGMVLMIISLILMEVDIPFLKSKSKDVQD